MSSRLFIALALSITVALSAAQSQGPFDGAYQGRRTLLLNGPGCNPSGRTGVWKIMNSRMTRPCGIQQSCEIQISADGSFELSHTYRVSYGGSMLFQTYEIQGKVSGQTIAARASVKPFCEWKLELTRIGD